MTQFRFIACLAHARLQLLATAVTLLRLVGLDDPSSFEESPTMTSQTQATVTHAHNELAHTHTPTHVVVVNSMTHRANELLF